MNKLLKYNKKKTHQYRENHVEIPRRFWLFKMFFFFLLLRLLLIKNLCGVFYSAPFKGKWGEKNNRNIIEGNKETREFQKIKQIITFQRETQTTKFLFKLHRLKN